MSIIMSSSYNLSFLKESNFVLYTCRITAPLNITWQWFEWPGNCTVTNHKRKWVKLLTSFGLSMRYSGPGQVHSQYHTYRKVLPSNRENNICGTICMQSHSPLSWDWLVAKWYKKFLASYLLKEIGRTTSIPTWSEDTYEEWLIREAGYAIWRGEDAQTFHYGKNMCLQLDRNDGWHGYW